MLGRGVIAGEVEFARDAVYGVFDWYNSSEKLQMGAVLAAYDIFAQ